jgi:DNA-binding IclR family transcriptional regulator
MDLTGLPKPTLFRLTDTLCELGLLRYSERLSKYVPGLGLLQLSSPVLTRMALRQFARPQMQALADLTEGQVQLAVGHKRRLCLVELANGMGNTVFRPEVGVQMSLSRTATGRAYLLGLSSQERGAYLQNLQRDEPQRAAWLEQRLVDARDDLERHGFCRSHGDLHSEIESIAVPMSQLQDGELWVFAVSVPVFSPLYAKLESDLGPRLRTLVRSVQSVLGAPGLS